MSFMELLGLSLIVLRLTGVIDWPWWAVLAPIWGPLALFVVILVVIFVQGNV